MERLHPASSVALSGLSVVLTIVTQGSATLHPALISGAVSGLWVGPVDEIGRNSTILLGLYNSPAL